MYKVKSTSIERRLLKHLSINEAFIYSVIKDETAGGWAHHTLPEWAELCCVNWAKFRYTVKKLVRGGWVEKKLGMPSQQYGGQVEIYLRIADWM
jgi:hypothetical protein